MDLDMIVPDQPADELRVTLRKPITLGSQTYADLLLREPTAAEWQQWHRLEGVDADIMAISVVSGVPRPVIERIGTRDLLTAARYIARFLA
ncbi:phage tail assembly protein [Sphingomonas sp. S-NIH.Pt15_0812]|uniref:phage tail assembly protein n=1 Tax=Sphingomonas sp. S-NIH.Pt15_0812 TaxID=1920129 RepID=UPI000F7F5371|nr:phage tail assembly protein [Sphingomonas sp. S-NIH.Pt15_0812]RSU46345.1 hypothetical protein BRX43_15910 [Sphingomonas sp. S-NIH.Pt15_0812]